MTRTASQPSLAASSSTRKRLGRVSAGRVVSGKSRLGAKVEALSRQHRVVNKALLGMTLVLAILGWHRIEAWYSVTTSVRQRDTLLFTLRKREIDYRRKNGAFAGSLDDLRVTVPPEIQGDIRVVAGRFAGEPGFILEYCDDLSCVAMDQEGRLLRSLIYAPNELPDVPSELEKGPGRFFISAVPEEDNSHGTP